MVPRLKGSLRQSLFFFFGDKYQLNSFKLSTFLTKESKNIDRLLYSCNDTCEHRAHDRELQLKRLHHLMNKLPFKTVQFMSAVNGVVPES